jgi:hypothetical protein
MFLQNLIFHFKKKKTRKDKHKKRFERERDGKREEREREIERDFELICNQRKKALTRSFYVVFVCFFKE